MSARIITAVLFSINLSLKAQPNLPPPILLEKEKMFQGNPLATYTAMLDREHEYLISPISRIYIEQKAMLEEFLGFPYAGTNAMKLFKTGWDKNDTIPASYLPKPALEIIRRKAAKTQIVIWGEEHHLPQTRNMYSELIQELWKLGYRYLAAEAFSDSVLKKGSAFADYESGLYTRDPIFAYAIHEAAKLGFKLIPYEARDFGPADDPGYRDRKQAENINEQVFRKDPGAKLLVFAGRGHASETAAQDGWKPMASVLKSITGIDPFTLFAPTMTERSSREEEHPAYIQALQKHSIRNNTLFVNPRDSSLFSSGSFDAYIFFPRVKLINDRPDWLFQIQGRKKIKLRRDFLKGKDMRLVQAFMEGQEFNHIPIDQVVVKNQKKVWLALPAGNYIIRSLDPDGKVLNSTKKMVR